jgi:imidazoleglycerol-phosphate dehydratase
VKFASEKIGELQAELLHDFFLAFCQELKCNLHIVVPYGRNDHHRAEAVFKAWGKAMRMACSRDPRDVQDMPGTTKGLL